MAKPKNLGDVAKQLDSIAVCLAQEKNRIEIAALETGMTEMIDRIFTKGVALDGDLLGEYSLPYLNKRINKLKVASTKKILFWEGNLKNSIQTGNHKGDNVIGFDDTDQADIAEFQETSPIQVNRPIFGLNENELKNTFRVFNEQLQKTIINCFK